MTGPKLPSAWSRARLPLNHRWEARHALWAPDGARATEQVGAARGDLAFQIKDGPGVANVGDPPRREGRLRHRKAVERGDRGGIVSWGYGIFAGGRVKGPAAARLEHAKQRARGRGGRRGAARARAATGSGRAR